MSKSSDTYRINVENAAYALVTSNSETEFLLNTIVPLPGLRTVDLTLQLASGKLYGDGVVARNIAQATGATLQMGINKIKIEDRAKILGHSYTNGIIDVKAGDIAPDIAIYFEVTSDKNTKEQFWLLCGTAQPFGISGQQREDNITFSTDTVSVEFKPRKKDKKVFRMADTSNADFTEALSKKFVTDPDATTAP